MMQQENIPSVEGEAQAAVWLRVSRGESRVGGHGGSVVDMGGGAIPCVSGTMGLNWSGMGSVGRGERPVETSMSLRASVTERREGMEEMGRGRLDATRPHGTTPGSVDVRDPCCRSRGGKIRQHVQKPAPGPEMAGVDAGRVEEVLETVERGCTENQHGGGVSDSDSDDARS